MKYFNAERHEENRYAGSLDTYSHANIRSQQTLAVLNSGQSAIIAMGVVAAMVLSARLVRDGKQTVGDFSMMVAFIQTLYQPLGFLGTYYRMIRQNMVDVESMLLLWREKPDIKDQTGAVPLQLTRQAPEITFDNVCFSYSGNVSILKGVSFTVPAGKKVAIVGASGSG